jgi:putative oxidoreductase
LHNIAANLNGYIYFQGDFERARRAKLQKINALAGRWFLQSGMTNFANTLPLVGRILYALIFVAAAPRHFSHEGIAHAAELGVPLAPVLVPLSGILAIAGGLSVATGFYARLGAWALVLFLVPVTLAMHQFWNITDPVERHVQLSMFAKNLSMLGAALFIATSPPGPFSLRA